VRGDILIKHVLFDHGWWYNYCIHENKSSALLNNRKTLKDFLYSLFEECPHEYFLSGLRCSKLKIPVRCDIESVSNHEISLLSRYALEINSKAYKSSHLKVQMFLLEHDKKTVAIEVPVWLLPEELHKFGDYFKSNGPLTGHIDILRIEDEKIWVWDYKPNAAAERYAATQTYFYALMLSARTGIPLEKFRCGWFDSHSAFVFKPPEFRKD